MGCDIHAYIEYKDRKDSQYWHSFGGRINPGRIYGMFAKLADVRNSYDLTPIAQPRGVPEDMASDAFEDYTMFISESEGDRYVTSERAAKWIGDGSSVHVRTESFISNPDWHSGSWCTWQELETAINDVWKKGFNGNETEWQALAELMKFLESKGCITRLVFWFDN